jgi:hypothetical protein
MSHPPDNADDDDPDAPQPLTADDLRGIDVPCPVCGYNLRDGAGGRCPECGTELTLDDLFPPIHDLSLLPAFDTKRPVPARERAPLVIMACVAFVFSGAMMIPAFMLAGMAWPWKALGAGILAAALGMFGPVLGRSQGRGRWTLVVGGAILVASYAVIALGAS